MIRKICLALLLFSAPILAQRPNRAAKKPKEIKADAPAAEPAEALPVELSLPDVPDEPAAAATPQAVGTAPAEAELPPVGRPDHFFRAGIVAANTFYVDQQIPKGLFTGFYRPYGKYVYRDSIEIMARGNFTLKRYMEQQSSVDQTSAVGILEVASFEANFANQRLLIGRGFFQLEQGFLFANLADGITYQARSSFGALKIMGIYSADYGEKLCSLNITGCKGETSPFNAVPGLAADSGVTASGQRVFGAAEYTTPEFLKAQISFYGLYSKDLIKEPSTNATKYEYNPYYGGVGLHGYIVNASFQYRFDGIYQGGDTYNVSANAVSEKNQIQAYAALGKINYGLPFAHVIDPQLILEAAVGSGDEDAQRASTAAQSNTAGKYTAFQSFGAYSAGLALKPRLTNLQVYRGGMQFRPFKFAYSLRNVGLQLKYSIYRKVNASGGISDPNATEINPDVGMAGDVALTYSARNDLQFFYGFGAFKPGQAYAATNSDGTDGRALRMAHIISLTLIF